MTRLPLARLSAGAALVGRPIARLTTAAGAAGDHVLRTVASTALTATMTPYLTTTDRGREADRLRFHADLARRSSALEAFVTPDGPPTGVEYRTRLDGRGDAVARVETMSFPSRYVPHHPDHRRRWADHRRNGIVWAQHWRHRDGPRPTIIVCHGFLASPYGFNSAFFSMPWFHSHGHDVVLVTLPFHSGRSEPRWGYSGAGLFTSGLTGLNEGIFQSVHDVRSLIAHLRDLGVDDIGVTGISLGGYITAALAATEPDLAFVVPNCAVVDLGRLLADWIPLGHALGAAHSDIDEADLLDAARVHSPLSYPTLVPHDRRLIIHGRGDRLSPPSQGEALQRHWDGAAIEWFSGSHLLHLGQAEYLRRMGRFLKEIEFGDSGATEAGFNDMTGRPEEGLS